MEQLSGNHNRYTMRSPAPCHLEINISYTQCSEVLVNFLNMAVAMLDTLLQKLTRKCFAFPRARLAPHYKITKARMRYKYLIRALLFFMLLVANVTIPTLLCKVVLEWFVLILLWKMGVFYTGWTS